jgi:hypothetical protein
MDLYSSAAWRELLVASALLYPGAILVLGWLLRFPRSRRG